VPLSINPDGAFFIGLKVGRRSAELILINFLGEPKTTLRKSYPWPTPPQIIEFVREGIEQIIQGLPAAWRDRVAGLGIATPFQLWDWTEQAGAPREEMDLWRDCDLRAELASFSNMPVYLQNDATAACAAELVFGQHSGLTDYLYFYIGTFVGGGVVLNGSVYSGRTGNAGALGPLPVTGPDGKPVQLIDRASIMLLERMLRASGQDPSPLWNSPDHWSGFEALADEWVGIVARGLAQAIVSAASIIDFEHVIIDGGIPADVREKLVAATRAEVQNYDVRGLEVPTILPGTVGHLARALGAASLPLFDKYLIDRNARLGSA
jgi:predicted NBD/HSP70 family sugar kinase